MRETAKGCAGVCVGLRRRENIREIESVCRVEKVLDLRHPYQNHANRGLQDLR